MPSECFITPETVKTQIKHIYEKLGVNSRMQAIQRGREYGLPYSHVFLRISAHAAISNYPPIASPTWGIFC